jgi:hypothetical protein
VEAIEPLLHVDDVYESQFGALACSEGGDVERLGAARRRPNPRSRYYRGARLAMSTKLLLLGQSLSGRDLGEAQLTGGIICLPIEESSMNSRSSQHTIRDFLAGIPGLRLAYLFGSRVDGSVGPLSDYDVAVLAVERNLEIAAQCLHRYQPSDHLPREGGQAPRLLRGDSQTW